MGSILLLGRFIPAIKRILKEEMKRVHEGSNIQEEDYADSILTFASFKQNCYARYLDCMKDVFLHEKAINCDVISLSDGTVAKLLDFQKPGRPLVVNFGSCT
ncbi:Type III iodothyronine deiodinase [Mizuhopecten yessoensis]|uniref:Iodothyronine deiodinase n=1 Tax=Mizuhopecten yessoensis TaxID=6573 RepID=A0A210QDR4_MIZYE|nr:Type III iodothyronine deiodinase [Mizuhopecten yessoensis]